MSADIPLIFAACVRAADLSRLDGYGGRDGTRSQPYNFQSSTILTTIIVWLEGGIICTCNCGESRRIRTQLKGRMGIGEQVYRAQLRRCTHGSRRDRRVNKQEFIPPERKAKEPMYPELAQEWSRRQRCASTVGGTGY